MKVALLIKTHTGRWTIENTSTDADAAQMWSLRKGMKPGVDFILTLKDWAELTIKALNEKEGQINKIVPREPNF